MNIRIRKADINDLRAIKRVVNVLKVPGRPWCDWHRLNVIRPAIVEKRCFVAERDGDILGAMSVGYGHAWMEIQMLAVRRSSCRQGVGVRLIRFARRLAAQRHKRDLFVETFSFYRALRFYLRCGFRIADRGPYRGAMWYQCHMPIPRRALKISSPPRRGRFFKRRK